MRKNISDSTEALIVGSTFFGTGGGGSPSTARLLYSEMRESKYALTISELDDFESNALFVSAFMVGTINGDCDPDRAIRAAYTALSQSIGRKVSGIIPVEIGPLALATAFRLAQSLDLPVLDADVVGGRSTPEVFLETITLFNVPRTPSAIANGKGDTSLLLESSSAAMEERFFRDFAVRCGGQAFVVGYCLTTETVRKAVELGTISRTIQVGTEIVAGRTNQALQSLNGRILYEGRITRIEDETDATGFTIKNVSFSNGQHSARLFLKNENLLFWIDENLVASCPDLIVLLSDLGTPIYNSELHEGQEIKVASLPGARLWRTPEGIQLFNPRLFGVDADPVLIEVG